VSDAAPTRQVLVLGRDERAFLAVVRSLGRGGLAVHVAGCPADALARRSRYVARAHDLPAWAPGDSAWTEAIVALCRAERFDLIVPCNDPALIPLHRERTALEPLARLAIPSPSAFDTAFDKRRSGLLARDLGIPVPREETLAMPADPAAVAAAFGLPVVVKPRASFEAHDLSRKREVKVVRDADALARALAAYPPGAEALVQEVLPGIGVGVELLAQGGEVLAAFQHARVHEPRKGGGSSYRRSVPLDPHLLDAARRLMGALAWTGVAMVEFRVDPATGRTAFLEINGRFWGSLPLAIAAGADFPLWLYQMLVLGRREFPQAYRIGLHARNWRLDLGWLAEGLRAPRGERIRASRLVAELAPLLTLRERSDTLVADDPAPGIEEARRLVARVARRALRPTRARLADVPIVRRRRTARAVAALDGAHRVLFVCKGNICRSPFAAAYARTLLGPSRTVASSGYFPRADRRSPAEAVAAAGERGVDLAPHRSTVLADDTLRAADAIFVFDEENRRTVAARWPWARAKVHLLPDLAADADAEIADPYGGTVDDFRETYTRITRILDAYADHRTARK
jgi:protein-tyrosine-phosphatase/predicted ATP-grasp superfamily ATP-dependent carboligase